MHQRGEVEAEVEVELSPGGGGLARRRAPGAVGRRAPDPTRRRALAEAVLEHVLQHGREELSLRSVAGAMSISTFALTANFGSRLGMIDAVIDLLVERQAARVAEAIEASGPSGPGAGLRAVWGACCAHLDEDRLLIDVCTDRRAGPGLRRRLVEPWTRLTIDQLVAQGWRLEHAEVEATLVTACFAGLELDLMATGDAGRVGRAAEAMADHFEARWARGPRA